LQGQKELQDEGALQKAGLDVLRLSFKNAMEGGESPIQ